MGLTDPRTGRRPYAVVQLRQENLRADSFNLVGFQNHMRFGEQARVLRMIPGLENAEFLRFGQIHRNTYINAPALLTPTLQLRTRPAHLFRRADLGSRRIRRIDRDRTDGGRGTLPLILRGDSHAPSRARLRSARCATTSPAPIRSTTSRPISRSICCPSSTRHARALRRTRRRATRKCAGARRKRWTNIRRVRDSCRRSC